MAEVIDNDGDPKIKFASCNFNARNHGMLKIHMKAEKKLVCEFKCKICSQVYPNQENLEVHMVKKHTGEKLCLERSRMCLTIIMTAMKFNRYHL